MATQSSTLAWKIPWTEGPGGLPYDYTVKVRNRFQGIDLIDREPDE